MKKTVLILCGGRSEEHEISLISAKALLDVLDRKQFEPLLVGISREGVWYLENEANYFVGDFRADHIRLNQKAPTVQIRPYSQDGRGRLTGSFGEKAFDVVFPMLHGPFGEDGTIQGLFDIAGVAYVGAGCGSSYVCMDKELTKVLARTHEIPTADFRVIREASEFARALDLGFPLFVKPARMGSSVGMSRVRNEAELKKAVAYALEFDTKCLAEQAILGREIECAVLGNSKAPKASLPGEIIPSPSVGWYSYEAKYLMSDGAKTVVPARLNERHIRQIQELSIRIFKLFECEGMARVDLFLEETRDRLYLSEINTIPGFTPISMYPKMWIASGLSYSNLITHLIELALSKRRLDSNQKAVGI